MINESINVDTDKTTDLSTLLGDGRSKSKGGKEFMTGNKKRATTVRNSIA